MRIKKVRSMDKKVYTLLLEARDTIYLSIQYAYSLEEAFLLAKLEFEKQNPGLVGLLNPLLGSKIGLFAIKSMEELESTPDLPPDGLLPKKEEPTIKYNSMEKLGVAPQVDPAVKKNLLMQKIILTKDTTLFKHNQKLFSAAERKYIRQQLKS